MRLALVIVVLLGAIGGFFMASPVMAQVRVFNNCDTDRNGNTTGTLNGSADAICADVARGNSLFGPGSVWNKALNILTFVIGATAVLMIILAGLRYVLANGAQSEIAAAKTTILYASVGLVVAVSANAIVNFVLANI